MLLEDGNWCVYIVLCADGTLYTGCTNHLAKRIATHNAGKGAKYTKGKAPVTVIYTERCLDRSTAQQREHRIKQLTREEKLRLVQNSVAS